MKFALGIGLTNACNLACDHCYRGVGTDSLSMQQVLDAVDAIPTRAVNFGTGENGLHPEFAETIQALVARGIAVTMTTNGHSAKVLTDDVLRLFRDVEFSIDYPDIGAHNDARGAGNWELIEEQMARCASLGVSTTLVSVLMSTNAHAVPALLALAATRSALCGLTFIRPCNAICTPCRLISFGMRSASSSHLGSWSHAESRSSARCSALRKPLELDAASKQCALPQRAHSFRACMAAKKRYLSPTLTGWVLRSSNSRSSRV